MKTDERMRLQLLFAPLYISVNAAALSVPAGATALQWCIVIWAEVSLIQLNAVLWASNAQPETTHKFNSVIHLLFSTH